MSSTQTILTTNVSEFFDLVTKEFIYRNKKYPLEAEMLFMKTTIPNNTGDRRLFVEADRERYSHVKEEGADVAKTEAGIGYEKYMYVKRFGVEIDVTYEFEHWNESPSVATFMKNVSENNMERYDLDLTHRLTFAAATTYVNMDGETIDITTGDSLALASAVHDLANSDTTYSNIVASAPRFSQGAFLLAQDLSTNEIYDNYGNPIVMDFNTVISSYDPSTCYDIMQILGSDADIDTSNSGVLNVNKRAFKHVKLFKLDSTATGAKDTTKSKYWMWAAIGTGDTSWQANVGIWEANRLAPINRDGRRDIWSIGSRMSYGICAVSAKGIVFSFAS